MPQPQEPNLPSAHDPNSPEMLDILGREMLNAAPSWASFWRPRFVRESSALVHLPFLFWLVESHRPQRIAQIGIGDGVAYLGLCQAVDKLGLKAGCRGISLLDAEPASLSAVEHNNELYEVFSILSTEKLTTAHRHYRKGSIDLLVVNAPLDENFAGTLAEKWNELLSDRCVVVVLDSTLRMSDQGANIWLDPLLEGSPNIELDQGDGLLVMAQGREQDHRIDRLCNLELGMVGYNEFRQIFQTIGYGIVARHDAEQVGASCQSLSKALEDKSTSLSKAQKDLTEARVSEEHALDQLGQIQANRFDLETKCEKLNDNLAEAHSKLADLSTIKSELENVKSHCAELEAALAQERQEAEAAILEKTKELEARAESRVAEIEQSRLLAVADLAKLKAQLAAEQERHEADLSNALAQERQEAEAAILEKTKELEARAESRVAEIEQSRILAVGEVGALEARLGAEQERHEAELKNALAKAREEAEAAIQEKTEELETQDKRRLAEIVTKDRELTRWAERYNERIFDIAELGNIITKKDEETSRKDALISDLNARLEELKIRNQILSSLASVRAELHAGLRAKPRFRKEQPAIKKTEEEVRLVQESDLFDATWYLAFYPDVDEAGYDAAHHFVTEGAYEMRNPGPTFDSFKYHRAYPDVGAARLPAFIHYIRYGQSENRDTFPIGERS